MHVNLSGKSALVTGSTAGIGLAIAKGLATTGASVWVNGRKQETVNHAVDVIKAAAPGANVRGIVADVATEAGCALRGRCQPPTSSSTTPASSSRKPFFDIPDADWMLFFETNVMSGVRLSRAYMPGMLAANWGRIIFISSESALNIPSEMIHYGMTKTAQLAVSRGLAELTAGTGVTVNSVLPGPTRSEGVEDFLKNMARQSGQTIDAMAEGFVREHRPTSLLQRFASVEEVANMVVYAASKEASATNGAALRVEGGIVRTIS